METETIEVHGIPIYFGKVDDPDRKYGGVDKSFNELKEGWLEQLRESEAVKKRAPQIKRIEIDSLAGFYFRDSEVEFHCKRHNRTTKLSSCQDYCSDWNSEDMECSADAIEEPQASEKYKQMLLDTMHVMRVYLK